MEALSGSTDLYRYAENVFGSSHTRRYMLFTLPVFVAAFRALPKDQQMMLWLHLGTSRLSRGHKKPTLPIPASFTKRETVDDWFIEFCREPDAFDFTDHIWRVGQCCPELWLRERFAERMEEIKVTSVPPVASYHAAANKRKRTSWQGALSPEWLHLCTLKIVGELDDLTYQAWLGPVDQPAKYPMLLIHEKAVQTGSLKVTKATVKLLVHQQSKVKGPVQKKSLYRKPINPGRDKQRVQGAQDRSVRVAQNIRADITMINLGGSLKDLSRAIAARIGRKPMLGSVIGWLRFLLATTHASQIDLSRIKPEYSALANKVNKAYEAPYVWITPSLRVELMMFGFGGGAQQIQNRMTQDLKRYCHILDRKV